MNSTLQKVWPQCAVVRPRMIVSATKSLQFINVYCIGTYSIVWTFFTTWLFMAVFGLFSPLFDWVGNKTGNENFVAAEKIDHFPHIRKITTVLPRKKWTSCKFPPETMKPRSICSLILLFFYLLSFVVGAEFWVTSKCFFD